MKTSFYGMTFLLVLLIFSCEDDNIQTNNDDDTSIENINLQGRIVFQENLTRILKTADINSLNDSKSFGTAYGTSRPIWSNDGTKFAVIELLVDLDEPSSTTDFAIKVVNPIEESVEIWEIGSSAEVSLGGPLTWSPDGNTIAFLEYPDNKIIYLNTINGTITQTEFLLEFNEYITTLAWRPNSNNIALNIKNIQNFETDNTLWLIEPYETILNNSTPIESVSFGIEHMDWNNDGTKLLISNNFYNDIYVLDINSGEVKEVANAYGIAPCWSYDGMYVLYTGISGLNGTTIIPGLIITDVEGSFEQTLLTNAGFCDWY